MRLSTLTWEPGNETVLLIVTSDSDYSMLQLYIQYNLSTCLAHKNMNTVNTAQIDKTDFILSV